MRQRQKPSKLDYVFTKTDSEIDHVRLIWNLDSSAKMAKTADAARRAYRKGDYPQMRIELMQINWCKLVGNKLIEEIWETIKLKYDEM